MIADVVLNDIAWWEVFLLAMCAGFGWYLGAAIYTFVATVLAGLRRA